MDSSSHILPLGKKLSSIQQISAKGPLVSSAHTISLIEKKNKPGTTWFFKIYRKAERPLAEYETCIGEIYRIILGEKAPKIRVVYNDSGEIIGSISKKLVGFVPLSKCILNVNQLIKDGLSEILFACYFNAEDDLHKGNFGSNGKIDHDMSAWPITSQFKGKRPILGHTLLPNPADAFPISKRDIKNFPNVQDVRPFYWPTNFLFSSNWAREVAYSSTDKHLFSTLAYNPDFEQNKFYTALKIILIPPLTFTNIAQASLVHRNRQREIIDFYVNRQIILYNTLLSLKEFRLFVQKNINLFKKVINELNIYNSQLKNKKSLIIDLDFVKKTFYKIWVKCHEYQITESLIYFNLFLTKNQNTHPSNNNLLKTNYDHIVSLCNKLITLEHPNNHDILIYVKNINQIITKKNLEDYTQEQQEEWLKIYYEIENSLQSLCEITLYIEPIDKSQQYPQKQFFPKQAIDKTITASEINKSIPSLAQSFLKWLQNTKKHTYVLLAISQATSQYAPPQASPSSWFNLTNYLDYRHYTRTRINEVRNYASKILQATSLELSHMTIDILNTGEWKQNSFNKILMRHLFQAFSEDYLSLSPLQQLHENMLLFNFYDCIDLGLINIENHFSHIHQEILILLKEKTYTNSLKSTCRH